MALGRQRPRGNAPGLRATALVIDADPPVSGRALWGSSAKGTVTILIDDGPDGPICVARDFKLTEDRWLVRGMEIPVSLDPSRPERFEVEWDAIPSIEERVAANDPTLADPVATRGRIAAALESAGVSGPAVGVGRRGLTGGIAVSTNGDPQDRLREAVREAAQKPAPPGKQRAVVVIATATSSGDTSSAEGFDASVNGPP
ncbi:MAG TPA: hypothetical protein VH476_10030 [Solirubrobacterales bacterium]|jgi:hypothetical protein